MLTLGGITLPVEALVLPNLGPDKMLLDDSIMGAFGASLNWHTQKRSFANSRIKVKATHRIRDSTNETEITQCSVVAVVNKVESVPVYLTKKCCIPQEHEMAVHGEAVNAPAKTKAALIEPRILTAGDAHSSDVTKAFHRLLIARTVCHWSATNKYAMVQIANPSNGRVYLERKTMLGQISPVKTVRQATVSKLQNAKEPSEATREELRGALEKVFRATTISSDQCSQVLDLCTKYRSVFSLAASELGKCTITEADFPLQPGTIPVDRNPYRANPCVQEVINKRVNKSVCESTFLKNYLPST